MQPVVNLRRMEDSSGDSGTGFSVALWLPEGVVPPPRLVQALSGKGIRVEPVRSPYAAMAAVCQASRAARAARGSVAGGLALIVVHPEQQPDAAAVLESASKYAPGVRCWMFGPATNPKLRAIVEGDVEEWGGAPAREPEIVVRPRPIEREIEARPVSPKQSPPAAGAADYRTQRAMKPPLRLAGQGEFDLPPEPVDVDKQGPEAGKEGAGPSRGQVLTPEELRMLLGEDGPDVAGQR